MAAKVIGYCGTFRESDGSKFIIMDPDLFNLLLKAKSIDEHFGTSKIQPMYDTATVTVYN